jgi:hypothetical protein
VLAFAFAGAVQVRDTERVLGVAISVRGAVGVSCTVRRTPAEPTIERPSTDQVAVFTGHTLKVARPELFVVAVVFRPEQLAEAPLVEALRVRERPTIGLPSLFRAMAVIICGAPKLTVADSGRNSTTGSCSISTVAWPSTNSVNSEVTDISPSVKIALT